MEEPVSDEEEDRERGRKRRRSWSREVRERGGRQQVGVERDLRLRLRADVGVDDDGCSLLRCRVVIMRGTRCLLSAHFLPDVTVAVCLCRGL